MFSFSFSQLEGNEPTFSSPVPDPPLSPISLLSEEGEPEDTHPSVHSDTSQAGSGHVPAEKPSLTVAGYKPQIPWLAPQKEAEEDSGEEQWETRLSVEEGGCSEEPGGILGSLLPTADVDSPSLTLCFWPLDPQRNLLQAGLSLGPSPSEDREDVTPPSLELPQREITDYMAADPSVPQNKAATAVHDGYFPQTAPACSTLCER